MTAIEQAFQHARRIALVDATKAVVSWDEQTKMPTAAGAYRAEQLTFLSGLKHQKETDAAYGELLAKASEEVEALDPKSDEVASVRWLRRDFERATKLPQSLVEALTKNSVTGQQAWIEARKQDRFEMLQPFLERTIELKREYAEAVGYGECMYDALLDEFEPGERTGRVRDVFRALRDGLVPLLQAIVGSDKQPRTDVLKARYAIDKQREIGMLAASRFGFDFEHGRLDITTHPFCTTLGPKDVRLTTRYDEDFFSSAFFGTIHEAGHGMYEQGLRDDWYGLPPGRACSMAIHESQSRLWENSVARSRAFWNHFFPEVRERFSDSVKECDADGFYRAVNAVQPSLIRVEADEVTYNLHIIIRFELEQAMIDGELAVADLPEAWNEKYRDFLGIEPPNNSDGVLQDIHWSIGYLGYFPTYALGNLYAAQFLEQADADLGGLDAQFERGKFDPLKDWLHKKIHTRGQCVTAADLVQEVAGQPLSEQPLLRGLQAKYSDLYGITV